MGRCIDEKGDCLNRIHEFAVKYLSLYRNPQTKEADVFEGFSNVCFDLGFEMDCGDAFVACFSVDAFHDADEFVKIKDNISDINLLGGAIFSKWRYITHWSYCEKLLDDNNRKWFINAFSKLAELSDREIDD